MSDGAPMRSYPKIKYPTHERNVGLFESEEVVVTEKLDGANLRFSVDPDDGSLIVGSKNVVYEDPDTIDDSFDHAVEYLRSKDVPELLGEWPGNYGGRLTVFGEAMHAHTAEYVYEGDHPHPTEEPIPNVVVFDIYDEDAGEWLEWELVCEYADFLGLETVPVVDTGDPQELDFEIPPSAYREPDPEADTEFDRNGLAEGIVIKRTDTDYQRAKIVHDEFKEQFHETFGGGPSNSPTTDAERFVGSYVTEARIEKAIHRLVDEGPYEAPTMEMMQDLPRAVLEDVMAEAGWELLNNDWELDDDVKGTIRSLTSKRCARVCKRTVNAVPGDV